MLCKNFYDVKPEVESSLLHKMMEKMPKGGLHHIHTTASFPIADYLKVTYDPVVYFNERDDMFKVFPEGMEVEDGYIQCVEMRNFYKDPEVYDNKLRNSILLREDQTKGLESHEIWASFQHTFSKVNDLSKYHKFFRQLL